MRFIKIITLSCLSLILLSIIVGLGFIFSINPNDYKTTLNKNISQQVGRPVTVQGDLHWSVFPQIGLQAEDVFVHNRPGFAGPPLLRADSLQLQLKLAPLLFRKIVIKEIHIRNAKISLLVKANGENNWSDLTKAQPAPAGHISKSHLQWVRLAVNKIRLDGIHLTYDDLWQGHHYDVQNLQYTGGFVLDNDKTPALQRLKLNGDVQIDAVHFDKTQLSKLSATLTSDSGILHLNNIETTWYDGTILANISADTTHKLTTLALKATVENANLSPMFGDLKYIDKITGTLGGAIDLSVNDAAHLPETLNGTLQFQIADGVVHGINLRHSVQLISKVILHKSYFNSEDNVTAFNAMTGDINIADGVATSSNIKLQSDSLETTGTIQANLPQKTFDMNLGVQLLGQKNNDQLIQVQTCLGGIFPVKVHGTFSKYKTEVATTDMISRCTVSGVINSVGSVTQSAKDGAGFVWNKLRGLVA